MQEVKLLYKFHCLHKILRPPETEICKQSLNNSSLKLTSTKKAHIHLICSLFLSCCKSYDMASWYLYGVFWYIFLLFWLQNNVSVCSSSYSVGRKQSQWTDQRWYWCWKGAWIDRQTDGHVDKDRARKRLRARSFVIHETSTMSAVLIDERGPIKLVDRFFEN